MRTLQEFQSDVLTPLRKERDEKMMATYDHISSLKSQYQREGNERQEEKIAFMKEQKEALKAFLKQQAFDLGVFNAKLAIRKTNSFNIFSNGMARIKQERRIINETYQDKIGLAFARTWDICKYNIKFQFCFFVIFWIVVGDNNVRMPKLLNVF